MGPCAPQSIGQALFSTCFDNATNASDSTDDKYYGGERLFNCIFGSLRKRTHQNQILALGLQFCSNITELKVYPHRCKALTGHCYSRNCVCTTRMSELHKAMESKNILVKDFLRSPGFEPVATAFQEGWPTKPMFRRLATLTDAGFMSDMSESPLGFDCTPWLLPLSSGHVLLIHV